VETLAVAFLSVGFEENLPCSAVLNARASTDPMLEEASGPKPPSPLPAVVVGVIFQKL